MYVLISVCWIAVSSSLQAKMRLNNNKFSYVLEYEKHGRYAYNSFLTMALLRVSVGDGAINKRVLVDLQFFKKTTLH